MALVRERVNIRHRIMVMGVVRSRVLIRISVTVKRCAQAMMIFCVIIKCR
jgi:hypothetical protein